MKHLSSDQIEGYQQRTLASHEVIAVLNHISGCPACRDSIVSLGDIRLSGLVPPVGHGAVLPGSLHLNYEEVLSYVDGTLPTTEREPVEAHMGLCTFCRQRVQDLREFYMELIALPTPAAPVSVAPPESEVAPRRLDPVWDLGLSEGSQAILPPFGRTLAVPPRTRLRTGSSYVTMGDTDQTSFHAVSPVGTAVRSNRPQIVWSPSPGAQSYLLSIGTLDGDPVAETTLPSATTSWLWPESMAPLERGRIYRWEVTAISLGGTEQQAPSLSEPEALFEVLDASAAAALEYALANIGPRDHWRRGLLFASLGLLDDAEQALENMVSERPRSRLAARLLEQVRAVRRR